MTDDQILDAVNEIWLDNNLGFNKQPVGFYLIRLKNLYDAELINAYYNKAFDLQTVMLDILAYVWVMLRKWDEYVDWSSVEPAWRTSTYDSPSPRDGELDAMALDISGMGWDTLSIEDHITTLGYYLYEAFFGGNGTSTLYTIYNSNALRWSVQVLRKYLNKYGV